MEEYRIQSVLMHQIRKKQPKNTAQVIADILHISKSSAFRRLSGEKIVSVDEAYLLCKHFEITLENIIAETDGQVIISMASAGKEFQTMTAYPQYLLSLLRYITGLPEGKIIYLTNEIPVCYFFTSPLLAAFKMYVWSRNTFHQPNLEDLPFSFNITAQQEGFTEICEEMINLYERIERTEVWTAGVLQRSLSQIKYCESAGLFAEKDMPDKLVAELEIIIDKTLSSTPDFTKRAKPRHLYFQPYFAAEDIILIKTGDYPLQIISTFFNPDYFISGDKRLIPKAVQRLDFMIRNSDAVKNKKSRIALSQILQKEINFHRSKVHSIAEQQERTEKEEQRM